MFGFGKNKDEVQTQISSQTLQEESAATTSSIVRLLGDKTTICQIVLLLAYIRNALKSGKKTSINVKIGHNIANGKLMFDVNNLEIPDIIAQKEVEID